MPVERIEEGEQCPALEPPAETSPEASRGQKGYDKKKASRSGKKQKIKQPEEESPPPAAAEALPVTEEGV